MFDTAYRRRLDSDLPKRREAGWVTADGASAILASVAARHPTFSMAAILGTLGALLVGLGIIVVCAALWAIYLGQVGIHPIGTAIGLTAFGAEVIYFYVVTLGTMIETALAFLGGGVLFIVLAFGLYRLDQRLKTIGVGAGPPPAAPATPAAGAP